MIKIFEIGMKKPSIWKTETSRFGSFIVREGLSQQIRLDGGLKLDSTETETKELDNGMVVNNITVALTEERLRFSSDPKTLNVGVKKQGSIMDQTEFKGEVLVIFMMSMDLPLIRYQTNYEIINTFRCTRSDAEERYCGCMICVPEADYSEGKEVLRLQAKDQSGYRFINIENGIVNSSILRNQKVIKTLDKEWKKRKERGTLFRVSAVGNMTSFIIGREKDLPEHVVDEIMEKWSHVKNGENLRVFLVPNNINSEAPSKELMKNLEKEISMPPKTRAVTIYKDAIALSALKKLRLLYIFGMDEHGNVTALKSN